MTIDGTQFTVSTDGTAPNSGPAIKRFVDANVSITPNGVNAVGDTAYVHGLDDGDPSGTTATLLSITPHVTAAARRLPILAPLRSAERGQRRHAHLHLPDQQQLRRDVHGDR